MSNDKSGIGNGMNATNTIRATIFSERAEERITVAVEKLVEHLTTPVPTAAPIPPRSAFNHGFPSAPFSTREKQLQAVIAQLEQQLAESNAKLSQRF